MTTPARFLRLTSAKFPSGTRGSARMLNRSGHGAETTPSMVVPTVEPWPHTTDDNGQSFPGGLVGVRFRYSWLTGTLADNDEFLVAVPATLPSGYTHRWKRDQNCGPAYASLANTRGQPTPQLTYTGSIHNEVYGWKDADGIRKVRLREGNNFYAYDMLPENLGTSCINHQNGGVSNPYWTGAPLTGLRYYRYLLMGNGSNVLAGWFYSWRARISRNADGSKGGVGEEGDTVLWEDSDDIAGPATISALTTLTDTGFVDPGFQSPAGTRAHYCFSVAARTKFGSPATSAELDAEAYLGGHEIWYGPNVDIPFPWTFTGLDSGGGHLIAPGGVYAGAIPGY